MVIKPEKSGEIKKVLVTASDWFTLTHAGVGRQPPLCHPEKEVTFSYFSCLGHTQREGFSDLPQGRHPGGCDSIDRREVLESNQLNIPTGAERSASPRRWRDGARTESCATFSVPESKTVYPVFEFPHHSSNSFLPVISDTSERKPVQAKATLKQRMRQKRIT